MTRCVSIYNVLGISTDLLGRVFQNRNTLGYYKLRSPQNTEDSHLRHHQSTKILAQLYQDITLYG
jgi:hypothetical protein